MSWCRSLASNRRATLSVIVAIAVSIAGCSTDDAASEPSSTAAVPATEPATTEPTSSEPTTTITPTTVTPTTVTPTTVQVSAYFVRDERMALVHRIVPATVATTRAAFEQLLGGTEGADQALGLSSAVPAGTQLNSASIENGIATIDLSSSFGDGGGSSSMRLRLAQVVFTATQFTTVQSVVLELDGTPVDVFGSEGIVLDQPMTRADFEAETPAIFVDDPAPFDTVGDTFRVSGTANVFEATFMVRVVDAAGTVRYEHFQMATSGTGTRGTFDFQLTVIGSAPGAGLLRLWEPSSKDGSDTNVIEIPIQIVT